MSGTNNLAKASIPPFHHIIRFRKALHSKIRMVNILHHEKSYSLSILNFINMHLFDGRPFTHAINSVNL